MSSYNPSQKIQCATLKTTLPLKLTCKQKVSSKSSLRHETCCERARIDFFTWTPQVVLAALYDITKGAREAPRQR